MTVGLCYRLADRWQRITRDTGLDASRPAVSSRHGGDIEQSKSHSWQLTERSRNTSNTPFGLLYAEYQDRETARAFIWF